VSSDKDFQSEILTGPWADLKPHFERGAVFVVSEDLDLGEVGRKVSDDDVKSIKDWLESEQLARPTEKQIKIWEENSSILFRFTIVAPYVLIQAQPH